VNSFNLILEGTSNQRENGEKKKLVTNWKSDPIVWNLDIRMFLGSDLKMSGCQQVLGLLLFLLLSLSLVSGRPEASSWSSKLPRGQQITNFGQTQQVVSNSGGLLPFPEGRGPDGTLYKTDY